MLCIVNTSLYIYIYTYVFIYMTSTPNYMTLKTHANFNPTVFYIYVFFTDFTTLIRRWISLFYGKIIDIFRFYERGMVFRLDGCSFRVAHP